MFSKPNFVFRTLLLFTFLLSGSVLHASIHSTVAGTIIDIETGAPLPGANVFIVGTSLGSSSDLDGIYSIMHLLPGLYTFRVTYIGYENQEKTIQLNPNETVKLDFNMKQFFYSR